MHAQSAMNFTQSSELSVQQSQISIPTRKVGLAKKLASLKEKIHLRKIQQIQSESESYIAANKQFCKREENILLNALQFINEVAQKGNEDEAEEQPEEERGVDEGYDCKLSQEEIQRPEFQELIREGEQNLLDANNIKNYTMHTKNYAKMLQTLGSAS